MVGSGGHARVENRRQVADAHLPAGQRPEDAQPVRFAHGLEQTGQGLGFLRSEGVPTGRGDAVGMDAADLAAVLIVSDGHGLFPCC